MQKNIRKQLTVRLYRIDRGWSQKARWLDRLPETNFDSFQNTLWHTIAISRIYICTYNSTTFLETFAANVPTIMFWNPEHWELRESAQPDYEMLREVGILHNTPESAADMVGKIWDDVEGWWFQTHIQKARERFCHKYAQTSLNWLSQWKDAMKTIAEIKN